MSEHGEASVADTEAMRTLDDARVAVLEAENTSRVLGKLLELRGAEEMGLDDGSVEASTAELCYLAGVELRRISHALNTAAGVMEAPAE